MLIGCLVFCLAIVGTSEAWRTPDRLDNDPVKAEAQIKHSWERFKAEFKPSSNLAKDQLEETERFAIFQRNYKLIVEHNAKYASGEVTFQMGINRFSDWNQEELRKMASLKEPRVESSTVSEDVKNLKQLPASVDWREKGAVTKVKDQNPCGCCYAFATIATLESAYFLKTGKLVSLSEQEIVDCATNWQDISGCSGGQPSAVFAYLKEKSSVSTDAGYPYVKSMNPTCKLEPSTPSVNFTIKRVRRSWDGGEARLQTLIATVGPVVASIDAMNSDFFLYSGGLFQSSKCNSYNLNHAVTVVGYGTDSKSKIDYWLVKNSWGTWWGESGYIRMRRNANNQCGIATYIEYITLA